jgi:hypothetical protein
MQFNKHNILKILESNELGLGSLVGQNDTIFNLISYTVKLLKEAGWIRSDILKVVEESKSGNYFHTVAVLSLCLSTDTEH